MLSPPEPLGILETDEKRAASLGHRLRRCNPNKSSISRTMNRFEKLSLVMSSVALVVALGGAALQPYLGYRYFDPSSKEFTDRGQFAATEIKLMKDFDTSTPKGRILKARFVLVNVGIRPIKAAQFVAMAQDGKSKPIKLWFENEAAVASQPNGKDVILAHPGAIAPGGETAVLVEGPVRHLFARNDYGDVTVLFSYTVTDDVIAQKVVPSMQSDGQLFSGTAAKSR